MPDDDDMVMLTEFDRGQLWSAALMMAPLIRGHVARMDPPFDKRHADLAERLANPSDVTDERLVHDLTLGWAIVQPKIVAAFEAFRQVAQQAFQSYQHVFETLLATVDLDQLREAITEEVSDDA